MRLKTLVVFVFSLVLAGCEEPSSTLIDDWVEFIDEEEGLSISYPADWVRAEETLTPNLASPREVLSIGTFPLEPGGPNCAQVPTNALIDLGLEDAFLTLQTRQPGPETGDRPVFGPGVGFGMDNLEIPYCLPEDERLDIGAMQWVHFADAGRGFYLLVAVGSHASTETVDQVWIIANSLAVTPATAP